MRVQECQIGSLRKEEIDEDRDTSIVKRVINQTSTESKFVPDNHATTALYCL